MSVRARVLAVALFILATSLHAAEIEIAPERGAAFRTAPAFHPAVNTENPPHFITRTQTKLLSS